MALADQAQELALGHDGVGQVEARELVLVGDVGHGQVLDEPVVERAVDVELERAERVGDALDGVALAVGEVVERVDAPRVAGAVMVACLMRYSNGSRIFMFVRDHVDLRAQHVGAVGELAGAHAREEVEGLLDAVGRGPGGDVPAP